MAKPKFFRDPVHLQIRFDPVDLTAGPKDIKANENLREVISWAAQSIIGAKEFQRLRTIRQNGLANLVFHGAEHSRFTHSLGVHTISRRMYDCICRNNGEAIEPEWKFTTSIAALTHDLGHGPFSHTLEEILKQQKVKFKHERITVRFLTDDTSSVCRKLKEIDGSIPAKIEAFFDHKKRLEDNWCYKIVSSQLDADRLDYLQRDALFSGLRGHGFDFERLLDLLYHHEHRIAVDRGAIAALESYIVTLDQMYRAIYYHHTVRAATQMLLGLFERAIYLHYNGDKFIFPATSNGVDHPLAMLLKLGAEIPLESYCKLSDHTMWTLIDSWKENKDSILSELANRICNRELFKTIELDPAKHGDNEELKDRAKSLTAKHYGISVDDSRFFVRYDDPSRTSYKLYDWRAEEKSDESIWLIGGKKHPMPLENDTESKIVDGLKKSSWFHRLVIPAEVRLQLN